MGTSKPCCPLCGSYKELILSIPHGTYVCGECFNTNPREENRNERKESESNKKVSIR